MSAVDYRRALEVEHGAALIGVVVEDPTKPRPIQLSMDTETQGMVVVDIDYAEAGEIFDTLAGAMRVVIAGQATEKLHPGDTPDTP